MKGNSLEKRDICHAIYTYGLTTTAVIRSTKVLVNKLQTCTVSLTALTL